MDQPSPQSNDDKLDRIVEILEHMNRRDRLRTMGGFFRGLLALIPLIIMLYSLWYFYNHTDEIMEKVARQAAEQAARVTAEGAQGLSADSEAFFEQLQQMMGR